MDSLVGSALGLNEWGSRFESLHRQSSFFEFIFHFVKLLCCIIELKVLGKLQKEFFHKKTH